MTSAADKARYHLEQSIPELRELERKNIFTKEEISTIIKKRSDFEHKLNARGARSTDFARYAEFEINLDALRKKRTKRLGVKAGKQNGSRRLFQVLDRATKKFHGDLALWMQYLSVCRQQRSYSKINEVLSNVIRMHPTKPEVWIYAASYSMEEQGDMAEARSYMQRGLRFCRDSEDMWLTYARLELLYISKIHARQKILGLSRGKKDEVAEAQDDTDADMLALPSLTVDDLNGTQASREESQKLENLRLTPALSGAIPMAIFDAAIKHFKSPDIGARFFDMVSDFQDPPCFRIILDHITDVLNSGYPTSSVKMYYAVRGPLTGISIDSKDYPAAIATAHSQMKLALRHPTADLVRKLVTLLVGILNNKLQEDIEQVVLLMLKRVLITGRNQNLVDADGVVGLLKGSQAPNPNIIHTCFEIWHGNPQLEAYAKAKLGREVTALIEV